MMTHICAGKILVQKNIAPVDGYVHLVHSNKNEFTLHIMTCIKIIECQNGQIYPEDTFSHGAAHIYFTQAHRLKTKPVGKL